MSHGSRVYTPYRALKPHTESWRWVFRMSLLPLLCKRRTAPPANRNALESLWSKSHKPMPSATSELKSESRIKTSGYDHYC